MNQEKITAKILTVQLHAMCEAVNSYVTLKYYEGNMYSIVEENGTIENLCIKYRIINCGNDTFDGRHLIGKKCIVSGKNGTSIFERYC